MVQPLGIDDASADKHATYVGKLLNQPREHFLSVQRLTRFMSGEKAMLTWVGAEEVGEEAVRGMDGYHFPPWSYAFARQCPVLT